MVTRTQKREDRVTVDWLGPFLAVDAAIQSRDVDLIEWIGIWEALAVNPENWKNTYL